VPYIGPVPCTYHSTFSLPYIGPVSCAFSMPDIRPRPTLGGPDACSLTCTNIFSHPCPFTCPHARAVSITQPCTYTSAIDRTNSSPVSISNQSPIAPTHKRPLSGTVGIT
jgi:hypothetical protein